MGETVHFEVEWNGRAFAAHVEPLRDAGGAVAGTIGVALDISDQRRAGERLLHVVRHDPLTGLGSRAMFLGRVQRWLAASGGVVGRLAVVLLDGERFRA